jgi:hypothetical protein
MSLALAIKNSTEILPVTVARPAPATRPRLPPPKVRCARANGAFEKPDFALRVDIVVGVGVVVVRVRPPSSQVLITTTTQRRG